MKHEYTDTQLQAAIDGACLETHREHRGRVGSNLVIDTDAMPSVYAAEANARLIAAAPDLLEALEKCASVIGAPQEGNWATDDEVNDAYDSAVAAIAKAKGEQL